MIREHLFDPDSRRQLIAGAHRENLFRIQAHHRIPRPAATCSYDAEQLDRYRSANDYAARFCHRLQQQLIDNDELALSELRRFYRLQLGDKISHIHSRAWRSA